MDSKSDVLLFYEFLLKEVYKNAEIYKKNKKIEIIINNKTTYIESKFEFKLYLRNLISSNNNNEINNVIRKIIEIKYKLKKEKEIEMLFEIYPNLDVFISAYLKLTKDYFIFDEIKKMEYNYDELFEYLIKKYISILTNKKKNSEECYNMLANEEKRLTIEQEILENKLKLFQVIKKNTFYYDTYTNSLEYETERFKIDNDILNNDLQNLEKNILILNKKISKINKKIGIFLLVNKLLKNSYLNSKIIELSTINNENKNNLIILNTEKNFLLKELSKLIKENKHSINRNEEAFKKFLSPYNITMEEYLNNYKESTIVDCKEILKQLNINKKELEKIKLSLKEDLYLKYSRLLKYFCADNLIEMKIDCEMDPIIIENILVLLEKQ